MEAASTTINRPETGFHAGLPPDPGSIFGGLLAGCIRDDYVKYKDRAAAEGVLFLLLGAVSSVITTYLLSLAGILL